jgi:hypothetical protein
MRKLAHLAAAALSTAALAAIMVSAPLAANASTASAVHTAQAVSAPSNATAAVARAARRPGQVTCVPVRSSKRPRLEHCSVAVALAAASAASRHDGVAFSAKSPVSLAAFKSALPANASARSAGVSGGCYHNVAGNQICTYSLNPGPRQACGGFNGNIQWLNDDWGMAWVQTWGEVWSLCAATAYVYLSWNQTNGAAHYNPPASGSASAYSSSGVNAFYTSNGFGGPSSMHETVCTTQNGGWHCGAGVYV